MSVIINQYGLSRDISESIARIVRQKCGFGCIFCGLWIYQYEHILPEFKDAKSHDPGKICLVCSNHHQKITQKRISKQQVVEQYKHPFALQRGYANDYLELDKKFGLVLGRIFFPEPKNNLLVADGIPLVSITQATHTEPMKLSAKFFDSNQKLVMEIVDNEQKGYGNVWDIEQKGTKTIVRRKSGDIVLQINIVSSNILKIEKINMFYQSAKLVSDSATGKIFIQAGSGATINFSQGEIITEGIEIKGERMSFSKGMIMGMQQGLNFAEMDYQDYMETGRIHS